MSNLNLTKIKPAPRDKVWDDAIDELMFLARNCGLSNMVGAPSKAIEKFQDELVFLYGKEFHETELCRNLSFYQEICDLMMNGCDMDHDNANRHDRIAMIDQLIDSLRTMRRRM